MRGVLPILLLAGLAVVLQAEETGAPKAETAGRWGSKAGAPEPKVWFVDLYRKDHQPYDPKEIEVQKRHIASSKAGRQ